MSDDTSPSPFDGLPDEFRRMLEQFTDPDGPLAGGLAGLGGMSDLQSLGGLTGLFGGPEPGGPVDWRLARQVAMRTAGEHDRSATDEETEGFRQAVEIAELWLDASTLPAPPDAGRVLVASRGEWIDAALAAMRPMVEPVVGAATEAMAEMARQQMEEVDLEAMGLGPLAGMLAGLDPGAMLRPLGARMAGLQAGQVLGELSGLLLHGTELGIPTGPRSTALFVAPVVEETFGAWELDPTEVRIALALHECARRRLFHAVGWLEGHVHELVGTFAEGLEVDGEQLRRTAEEVLGDVDPSDPESLQAAMEAVAGLRPSLSPAQHRVLERIQGVDALVVAWTRHEVAAVAGDRLPGLARIEEVLRRRRALRADGDHLLATLLGLDLTPDDTTLGDAFIGVVTEALGPEGLRGAIAHPENLPDLAELADPYRWLDRVSGADSDVPDDVGALLDGLGDAPTEASAEERIAAAREERGDRDDDA